MEYAALFLWLSLCLALGALMQYVMSGALSHRLVRFLTAPGVIVSKLTMTLVALTFGATVKRAHIYDLSDRDIDIQADGVSSVAKILVPLAPLFGGAVAVVALNSLFRHPLDLRYTPPSLDSLDAGGFKGFIHGTWTLLWGGLREAARADWHTGRLYVLFGLIFSVALGACAPASRVKEAVLGAGLLAVVLAISSSVTIHTTAAAMPRGWFSATRSFVIGTSGVAFIMMVYGMMVALIVGTAVRLYELVAGSGSRKKGKTTSLPREEKQKEAA